MGIIWEERENCDQNISYDNNFIFKRNKIIFKRDRLQNIFGQLKKYDQVMNE